MIALQGKCYTTAYELGCANLHFERRDFFRGFMQSRDDTRFLPAGQRVEEGAVCPQKIALGREVFFAQLIEELL